MRTVAIALDRLGNPIQAVTPDATVSAAIGATSVRSALPTDTELVRITSLGNCFFRFGNSAVTATSADTPMVAGTEIMKVPDGATHVAVIQNGAVTSTVYFTRMV